MKESGKRMDIVSHYCVLVVNTVCPVGETLPANGKWFFVNCHRGIHSYPHALRVKSRFCAVCFLVLETSFLTFTLNFFTRTPYAQSTKGYPLSLLFNEPLESDWKRHWKLNLKIQASQGSQKRPIPSNKILFWLNTPQCILWYFVHFKSRINRGSF